MATPLAHATLRELVQNYRTLASELRGAQRRRPGVTTYSLNRVVRMNRVIDELILRGQEALCAALGAEYDAYELDDSGEELRRCRRAVKETLARVEHEESYRKQLLERYEELHEVFTDKRSRETRLVAEINAWRRTVQHMPAMEQAGVVPGSNKWYLTFLEIFGRVTRGERKAFAKQLDDLVHEYRLRRAGVMGYAPQVLVRQKNAKGVVRTGRIVNLRTAGGTYADVDWGHGDPVRGYPIDELDVHFPPEQERAIRAEISYTRGLQRRQDNQVVFDDFEEIVEAVRDMLERGASEIHIDNIEWDG